MSRDPLRTERADASDGAALGRGTAAFSCLLVVIGVALSAYAAHGAEAVTVARLERAGLFLMLHGAAAAALLLARPASWPGVASGLMIVLGVALFSGSLVASALFGAASILAPAGGVLLMAGWLCAGGAALRSRRIDPR